jgi:hypothetical protein
VADIGDNRSVDLSNATIAGLAAALKGPVENTYTAVVPGVEAKLDKLYGAINSVASKLDSNARSEADSAAVFARAVTEMKTTISGRRGGGKDDDKGTSAATACSQHPRTAVSKLMSATSVPMP